MPREGLMELSRSPDYVPTRILDGRGLAARSHYLESFPQADERISSHAAGLRASLGPLGKPINSPDLNPPTNPFALDEMMRCLAASGADDATLKAEVKFLLSIKGQRRLWGGGGHAEMSSASAPVRSLPRTGLK
ncbi:hypothetical protein CC78DRAFT_578428 [Lojkania enalia]|uniref:Uncharacterized protein n=1 Tax=Lojkania enalia TaxID=147567 RepID=A0A9P4KBU1_9PLEO|nr:hypothetical protein CC78DRAFT_578428 [Didymosphaeria enalia]